MTNHKKRWRLRSSWWRRSPLSYPSQQVQRVRAGGLAFFGTEADAKYVEWLAEARKITPAAALAYCEAMDRRKLITSHHATTTSRADQQQLVCACP